MFGTATRPAATRALLLGSGELGKEVAIELQRLGIEVIAADRYANAPAMQVAHAAQVLDMLDGAALRALVAEVKPDLIIPEIEAIATDTLFEAPFTSIHGEGIGGLFPRDEQLGELTGIIRSFGEPPALAGPTQGAAPH